MAAWLDPERTPLTRRGWSGRGSSAHRGVVVAITALLAALGVALPSASSGAAATKWTVRAVPAVGNYPLHSVSCSAKGCVALGQECSVGGCGGLLPAKPFYSVNGGLSWSSGALPASVGDATAVSCGSPDVCVSTAIKGPLLHRTAAVLMTNNGGKSFAVHLEAAYVLTAAACASATSCFALGSLSAASSTLTSSGLVTSNAGRSFAKAGFPGGQAYIDAATCGAPTACLAVGENSTYTDGVAYLSANAGKSWKAVTLPAGAKNLTSVSCNGAWCASITATQVLISKNAGKSWTMHLLPTKAFFESAACLTASECMLFGYETSVQPAQPEVEASGNTGASWSKQVLPHETGDLNGGTCLPGACLGVGVRLVYKGSNPTAEYPLILGY
jgi:hypothetical protein